MRQADIFLESEGNAWFERNRDKPRIDHVTHCIAAYIGRRPNRVLEIGCGAGFTLAAIRELYACEVLGIEPSIKAGIEAAGRKVPVLQMTASTLPEHGQFDLIIYGFCLYLTDPGDWFKIVAEGDRVLAIGGHIIIHDFGGDLSLHGVPYVHDPRITSWHYDWAKLWLGHPAYEMTHRHWTTGHGHPDQQCITILRKKELKP
jgi:SAM-dependent methyltransferase